MKLRAERIGGEFSLQLVVGNVFQTQGLYCFQRTQAFEQRFFEGAADGHYFADGFHLRAEYVFGIPKLFEIPFGNLRHDVIDGGLE